MFRWSSNFFFKVLSPSACFLQYSELKRKRSSSVHRPTTPIKFLVCPAEQDLAKFVIFGLVGQNSNIQNFPYILQSVLFSIFDYMDLINSLFWQASLVLEYFFYDTILLNSTLFYSQPIRRHIRRMVICVQAG